MGDEAAQEGIKEPQSGWEVEKKGYTLTHRSYQQALHKTGYKRFCECMEDLFRCSLSVIRFDMGMFLYEKVYHNKELYCLS